MRKVKYQILLIFLFGLLPLIGIAQPPADYYQSAEGQTGYALKTALQAIIQNGHVDQGYSALWTLYETSDVRDDGKVWDMYSNCDFTFGTDQDNGTGGTVECDKYNREHTMPQSWFNSASPMRSDPFHVIPTDKKVNGERGNMPYGEVTTASYTSGNGSKIGPNTIAGYSGTVFEPIDEYKGDIARGYFYMATRYEDLIDDWAVNTTESDVVLNGTTDQAFESWVLTMLINWHELDPVSQKEIDRNEAIYAFQGNRNPFIDHPEWVSCIWENVCTGANTPVIEISESLAQFPATDFGNASASQSYTVSASNLTNDLVITSSSDFEIALTDVDANYGNSINITPASGEIAATTIFVRFKPATDNNSLINGTITHTSTGANPIEIQVQGLENDPGAPNSVSFVGNFSAIDPATSYTIDLQLNQAATSDLIINLFISSTLNLTYESAGFTTVPMAENASTIAIPILAGESAASLLINFGENVFAEVTKKIEFQILSGTGYEVGSNATFNLTINPGVDNTVTAVEPIEEKSLRLSPNPANQKVNIEPSEWVKTVRVFTANGVLKYNDQAVSSINIRHWPAGIYWVQVITDNELIVKKLVVKH